MNCFELIARFIFLIVGIPLALCLLLIILYFTIIFWNAIVFGLLGYFGIAASVEVDGIRLSNRVKTINRLLLWQDICEVSEVFHQQQSLARLLRSWEDEGDSQEHLETWEFIEQIIDRV